MKYPAKIMRASALEKYLGVQRGVIARLYHMPGQKFAWKNGHGSNSPVLIDTDGYERFRQRQISFSANRI